MVDLLRRLLGILVIFIFGVCAYHLKVRLLGFFSVVNCMTFKKDRTLLLKQNKQPYAHFTVRDDFIHPTNYLWILFRCLLNRGTMDTQYLESSASSV